MSRTIGVTDDFRPTCLEAFSRLPYPFGHAALGFAAHELTTGRSAVCYGWQRALWIIGLANMPDIDILAGLLWCDNGWAFHRGPTHSVLFALLVGFLGIYGTKTIPQLPRLSFLGGFSITLSHVVANLCFTSVPLSLWWPWQWAHPEGQSPLPEVLTLLQQNNGHDAGIILVCAGLIAVLRLCKSQPNKLKHLRRVLERNRW